MQVRQGEDVTFERIKKEEASEEQFGDSLTTLGSAIDALKATKDSRHVKTQAIVDQVNGAIDELGAIGGKVDVAMQSLGGVDAKVDPVWTEVQGDLEGEVVRLGADERIRQLQGAIDVGEIGRAHV